MELFHLAIIHNIKRWQLQTYKKVYQLWYVISDLPDPVLTPNGSQCTHTITSLSTVICNIRPTWACINSKWLSVYSYSDNITCCWCRQFTIYTAISIVFSLLAETVHICMSGSTTVLNIYNKLQSPQSISYIIQAAVSTLGYSILAFHWLQVWQHQIIF